MVIARAIGTVRKHYIGRYGLVTGEIKGMLGKYIRRRKGNQDCPVVLSITETTTVTETDAGTVIQRNQVRETDVRQSNDIYVHAREIYLRARRQRMAWAASIF